MAAIFFFLMAVLAIGVFAGLRGERYTRFLLAGAVLTLILYQMFSIARHY
jgi:uncharacterized membrane protein